jgi:translation elongation factor P/translation initiation factor 5A
MASQNSTIQGSLCEFVTANSIHKNGFVILQGRPCKVLKTEWSKPGKHGHGKIRLTGRDVITDKKIVDVLPSHDKALKPLIEKVEGELLSVDEEEEFCNVLFGEESHEVSFANSDIANAIIEAGEGIDAGAISASVTLVRAPFFLKKDTERLDFRLVDIKTNKL